MSMDSVPPLPEFIHEVGIRKWKHRLATSLVIGVLMTAVPLLSGWLQVRSWMRATPEARQSFHELTVLDHTVKRYTATHH